MVISMHAHNSNPQSGFTLVEMIVSLAVFSVVITMSVGALLMLVASNSQLQKEQSVMTNLSFAIDSMTREIRTGTLYYCDAADTRDAAYERKIFSDNEFISGLDVGMTQDCASGNNQDNQSRRLQGMSFVESGQSVTGAPNTRIVYFYDADEGKIYRRISGQAAQSIVSSGIYITNAEFFVTGSASMAVTGDFIQPTVTIFIEAKEVNDPDAKTYRIQTMVTQRTLDI
jgi:prepilin-type N-terminal cleavage/methylation domain-containing protein